MLAWGKAHLYFEMGTSVVLVELSFLSMFRGETRKAIVFEMGLEGCVEFHV